MMMMMITQSINVNTLMKNTTLSCWGFILVYYLGGWKVEKENWESNFTHLTTKQTKQEVNNKKKNTERRHLWYFQRWWMWCLDYEERIVFADKNTKKVRKRKRNRGTSKKSRRMVDGIFVNRLMFVVNRKSLSRCLNCRVHSIRYEWEKGDCNDVPGCLGADEAPTANRDDERLI